MNDIIDNPVARLDIQIDRKHYSIQDFLDGVESVLEVVKKTDNFDVGLRLLQGMSGLSQAAGLSLAKLLHGLHLLWMNKENADEDEFFDMLAGCMTLKRITLERYIDAWDALVTIVPLEYRDQMMGRPTRDLVKLGETTSRGYVVENGQWNKLLQAQNSAEFASILRGVKNAKPRKSSLTLYLERSGDIVGFVGDKRLSIGYLYVDDKETAKAIERIVKSAGIIKR